MFLFNKNYLILTILLLSFYFSMIFSYKPQRYHKMLTNSNFNENDKKINLKQNNQNEPQEVDYEEPNLYENQDYSKRDINDQDEPLDENDFENDGMIENQNDEESLEENSDKFDEKRDAGNQYNDLSDDEIALALSRLTPNELMALDNLIKNEDEEDKMNDDTIRETRDSSQKRKNHHHTDEDNDDDGDDDGDDDYNEYNQNLNNQKRCFDSNCNGRCILKKIKIRSKRSDTNQTTPTPVTSSSPTPQNETNKIENVTTKSSISNIEKKIKRHASPYFKRENNNAERKIQAKINFLRDKYKRELLTKNKLESNNSNKIKKQTENIRRKRENQADNPQSPEHIKLLEESFPKPESANSFQNNIPHIRVKRGD